MPARCTSALPSSFAASEANSSNQMRASMDTIPSGVRDTACSQVSLARTVPSDATSTAFELEVPTSNPRTASWLILTPLDRKVSAYYRRARAIAKVSRRQLRDCISKPTGKAAPDALTRALPPSQLRCTAITVANAGKTYLSRFPIELKLLGSPAQNV